jgi:predicted transcriptional regulator
MPEPQAAEAPLLSPSEWRVFSAVLEAGAVSLENVAETLGDASLAAPAVEAILERLTTRAFLLQEEDRWRLAPGADVDAILRRQIARFLDTYIRGHARVRALLLEMIEEEPAPAVTPRLT